MITREKNTYSKNDPDVPKLSRIERLKKFISKVIAFFRNTEEENDPNEQNKKQSSSSKSNMHGYGRHSSHYMRDGYESHESNNSRNCSRRASEISRDSDKERLLDDKKTKSDGEEGKEHEGMAFELIETLSALFHTVARRTVYLELPAADLGARHMRHTKQE